MDLLFANTIMLPVTTWLGWTAATSVPLMEGYLPPVEGTAWPVAVAVVSVAFLATGVSDLIRSSHVSAVPSALMAVLVGALALRLLFLPFLVIDLIVASALMSLGMMMLSPTVISMPFKLLLFVLVDGWALTMGSLASSFGT